MDFHSLARKDLQALCKKNKIPANLTNVAMADALRALHKVEGLDELGNAQQSPERTSNAEPRTACRTSTRRKLVNVEPESSQLLTRTRRTTRRTVVDNESKNVDLPETPAPTNRRRGPAASTRRKIDSQLIECAEDEKPEVQEKSDMAETPAIRSSKDEAPAVSTRRKVKIQKDEKSVQRVSCKSQSVRLLEKTIADLSLKEERKVEAVKIEGLCDETEEVEQGKDLPDESLENEYEKNEAVEYSKTNDDEVDKLLENECVMVDEDNKSEVVDFDESQNIDEFLGSESERKVELAEDNGAKLETETCANSDNLTGLDAEDDNDSLDTYDIQVKTSDKAIDMIHESIDEKDAEMNPDLEKEIEKELEGNQYDESNDNSPFVMEAEEHRSNTDVPDENASKSLETNQQKVDELDAIDAQISVDVDDWDKTTPSSVEQKSPLSPLVSGSKMTSDDGHVEPSSVEQKSPFSPLVSDSEITAAADDETCVKEMNACVSWPFAGNTIQGQFPRPTVEKKMIMVDMKMINKENIESDDKVKLNEMSLRQLTKAVKEKLQIKKNVLKVVSRPALQKLPQNAAEADDN